MDPEKHFEYYRVAKEIGIPNIILTGIEKKAKEEFPDDDEMFACRVLKRLNAMADKHSGDWSRCEMLENDKEPTGAIDHGKNRTHSNRACCTNNEKIVL